MRLKLAVRQALLWEITGHFEPDSELGYTTWELSRVMGITQDPQKQLGQIMPLLVKEAARRWIETDHDGCWFEWESQAHKWNGRWVLASFQDAVVAVKVTVGEAEGIQWEGRDDLRTIGEPQALYPLERIRWIAPTTEVVETIEADLDAQYHIVIGRIHSPEPGIAIEGISVWNNADRQPRFFLNRNPMKDVRDQELESIAIVPRDNELVRN